jgi:putative ABC transport system permease protein
MRDDLRIAFRSFRKNPAFAAVAIAPLAVGIGFTTAIFSIANALLFRPLPFADGARLMFLQSTQSNAGNPGEFQVAAFDYEDWKRENRSFSSMGAALPFAFNLTGTGRPQRVTGYRATASLFSTLGVHAAAGRLFTEDEERADASTAIISFEFWQTQFGRSRATIGRSISLDGRPYTIAGVLPRGLRFVRKADVFVPFRVRKGEIPRNVRGLNVVGRLRPGVSRTAAEQEMRGIASALARAHPDTNKGWGISVRPMRDILVETVRSSIWLLLAAAGFLLLVACVNVSNLLLARAAGRRGEAAVRAALGANRRRLIASFLAESVVLAAAGCALGVAVAWAGLKPLLAMCPAELSAVGPVGIDLPVLAFAVAVSFLSAVLFGSAAGWEGSRTNLAEVLNDSGRSVSGGRGVRKLQSLLVIGEVAVAFLLAVGSVVAFLAFHRLGRVPPGFQPDGALSVTVVVAEARYPEIGQRSALVSRLRESLSAIPRVASVGASNKLPLDENYFLTTFLVEGGTPPADDDGWMSQFRRVTPAYFASMGIRIAEGREFTDDDVDGKPLVAVVSRELARRHWPGRSPLGMRLQRTAGARPWITVVGVAEDVHDFGLAAVPPPTLYIPYSQGKAGLPEMSFVLRAALPPAALARAIRERIAAIDPDLPAGAVLPLSTLVADSLLRQRFQMILMGILAAAGIALAGVGIFGLIAYSVSQQSKELAIRLALGATSGNVCAFVAGRGARLAALGLGAGIVAVAAGGRVLQGVLPGTPAPGIGTAGAVAAVFGSLCIGSSWLAARRAASIAPGAALAQAGAR